MEQRELINVDGLVIDAESGEIVEQPQGFVLDSLEKLDWYVGKIRQLSALARTEAELAHRVQKRANAMGTAAASFERAFAADAERVARPIILKGRKSAMLEHGEVGFRMVPGGVDILDNESALSWCEDNLPEAVKVSKSLLKTPLAEASKAGDPMPSEDYVVIRPATEKFWVK